MPSLFAARIAAAIGMGAAAALCGTSPAWAQAAPAPAAAAAPAFDKEQAADLPGFNIHRPADLAKRRRPAPVVVWANGGCAPFDAPWSPLFQKWASAGLVVISINKGTPPPAMMAPPPAGAPRAMPPLPATMPREMLQGIVAQARSTGDLQAQAIDWAARANAARGGPYAGKLDLGRVMAAGNSCGGISSLNLAARDSRVKAVLVLTGSSVGPGAPRDMVEPVMSKVAAPTVWIVGGAEDIARKAAELDFELLPKGTPGALVRRTSGDHGYISRTPGALDAAGQIGPLWIRANLYGDRAAARALATRICDACDAAVWSVQSKGLVK